MNKLVRLEYGIDTYELSLTNLKYSQVQKVIENLSERKGFYSLKEDTDNVNRSFASKHFKEQGINAIRLFQSERRSNGIFFAISPASVQKGEHKPLRLSSPESCPFEDVKKELTKVFRKIELQSLDDSEITTDRLKLSRVDITLNCWFDQETDLKQIIRLFHHSRLPCGFRQIKNNDGYFNCGTSSGNITIKAYDKVARMKQLDECPKKRKDDIILRIEITLMRDKFIELFSIRRKDSIESMLQAIYDGGLAVILDYLKQMFPCRADHNKFKNTKSRINEKIKEGKKAKDFRERMIFLIEKTEKKNGQLDLAIEKLMKEYKLQANQIDAVLKKFDKIGCNPITIPNKSEIPSIPNISRLIEECDSIVKPVSKLEEDFFILKLKDKITAPREVELPCWSVNK